MCTLTLLIELFELYFQVVIIDLQRETNTKPSLTGFLILL